MKYFNTLHKGFHQYRLKTRKDKDCINSRIEVKQSSPEEYLICKKLNIVIEEDWINEIEEGLRHVAEAVNQERQFIKTNGDVVPIEKVKRVSKASIVHLARHSELITKMPEEGEILIPDKVYMEEKLSDYTVYENRFLYTLLIYLQQFVNMRLDQINEVINTYSGQLYLNKTVENKTHKMSIEIKFNEERYDTLNEKISKETFDLIERLDMISREIISLLACNLMKEVSKAPLVKPPLVKTNVLKGNKNFKAAVLLYDFINAFDRNGYKIDLVTEEFEFNNEIADEYSELVCLTSLLTYKFGNHLTQSFKNTLELEEEEEKRKEAQLLQDKINKIKNKVEELGIPIEEYVLMLEQRNTSLEQENLNIVVFKEEIDSLKRQLNEVNESIDTYTESNMKLMKSLTEKSKEVNNLNQKLEEEIALGKEKEIEFNNKLKEVKQEVVSELEVSYQEKQQKIEEAYDKKKTDLTNEYEETKKDLNDKLSEQELEIKQLKETLAKVEKNRNFIAAQLIAFRSENDLLTELDDYSSKERFLELEKQYFAFESFFNEEWKKAKRKIRKKYLSK